MTYIFRDPCKRGKGLQNAFLCRWWRPCPYRCLEFGKIISSAEKISFTARFIWKSVMLVILVVHGNFRQLHRSSLWTSGEQQWWGEKISQPFSASTGWESGWGWMRLHLTIFVFCPHPRTPLKDRDSLRNSPSPAPSSFWIAELSPVHCVHWGSLRQLN